MTVSTPEIKQGDQLAEKAGKVFDQLPLAYKRYATNSDYLMLLGGLKTATDFSFLGETWNEEEFAVFKNVFESQGLKLSKVENIPLENGAVWRKGVIFDPVMLEKETSKSKYAPPYRIGMDVHQYVEGAVKAGYDEGGIWGKIYSFPESAVGNYVEGDGSGLRERVATHNGGETYWFFDPPSQDVIDREEKKSKLFNSLENSAKYHKLMDSEDLKKSNEEWSRRIAKSTRRK